MDVQSDVGVGNVTVENIISLADLSVGQQLEGVVKKVILSGAIVDVGAPVDGLLHISDLGQKGATRTSDVLSEGQKITVWVKRVDLVNSRLSLTMIAPPRFTWNDLKPGLKTEGKVVRLEKFGAFVDIGAEIDGLVHISEMGSGRVSDPSQVVRVGDVVTVWVKEADRKSRRLSLTMKEPPAVDIRSLKPDMILTGKVVRLEKFGAFVDIGAGRDGMIHVTEMGRGYVGNPSDLLAVGDEVQVRVIEVDPGRGRIALSMKDLPGELAWVEDDGDDTPTPMEVALRAAMEQYGVSLPIKEEPRRRRKARRSRVQDEIIERTLRSHK